MTVLASTGQRANGSRSGRPAMRHWSAPAFEIEADGPVAAGIDGEATVLDPPLRFTMHPGALRVRVAPSHPGASPSALEPEKPWQLVQTLAGFALTGGPRELVQHV